MAQVIVHPYAKFSKLWRREKELPLTVDLTQLRAFVEHETAPDHRFAVSVEGVGINDRQVDEAGNAYILLNSEILDEDGEYLDMSASETIVEFNLNQLEAQGFDMLEPSFSQAIAVQLASFLSTELGCEIRTGDGWEQVEHAKFSELE